MKRGMSGAALVVVVMTAAALPAAAQVQLNPTVTVLPRATGPVPPECETGVTSVAPRVSIGEPAPAPAAAMPAPSGDLANALRRLQVAARGDDYDEFKAALASAHASVGAYPPGGERNAANEALAVYDDIEHLWDYANSSPT